MNLLEIHLLGSFQVGRGKTPITGFESNKVRALLAYLVVEANTPHQRRKLAAMFWPEFPESTALSNLRYALSNLREVIGDRSARPPYLEISPQTIQFNINSRSSVDVSVFEQQYNQSSKNPLDFQSLNLAAELFRGEFLEGLSVPDSSNFEEWVMLKRDHLNRLANEVFYRLANDCEVSGDYRQAISFAERQLGLDPWREEAHRQLMRCLYFSGQRNAALAQYETCHRTLADEMGIEPDLETQQLRKQIYEDNLTAPPTPPAFLRHSTSSPVEHPRFVSRQDPLNRLHKALEQAVSGQGQLLLVTGSPGQGKTALVREFMHQALEAHPELAAAWGNSYAYFGSGDPYLPFREILEMLTGQVEHLWEAGAITQDHARRMWHLIPNSARALAQQGFALIGTFVSSRPLFQRVSLAVKGKPDWLGELCKAIQRPGEGQPPTQDDLFQQYCRVLTAIAHQTPLLLFLDDLQWADTSSLGLLFHLSRLLSKSRILIIGVFRPVEGLPSSNGDSPSLTAMLNELRLLHGDILINLDDVSERNFLDAYLDLEPNQLDEAFRDELFKYTNSHPLFTIEMLFGMQERGDLIQNREGKWVASQSLNWDYLPPRVEAAVAERLRNLPQSFLELLKIASIEGERFTAEVAAQVEGGDEQKTLKLLRGDLEHKYRLIQADSSRIVNGKRLSRFRFSHILFQRYLYNQLDVVERAQLHQQVGAVLEEYFSGMLEEIAVQLAYHFRLAGFLQKAIHYFQFAGQHAIRLSSFKDAISHFNTALSLLKSEPETVDRNLQELNLLMSLSAPLMLEGGYASPELGNVGNRMRQLLNDIPLKPELFPTIVALSSYYSMRADYQKALAVILQGVRLAESSGNDLLSHIIGWGHGFVLLGLGELSEASSQLEKMVSFYDPHEHQELRNAYGADPGIASLTWSSWTLWLLGYTERALSHSRRVVDLGLLLGDPDTQLFAQTLAAFLHLLMRETKGAIDLLQSCSSLMKQYPMPLYSADLEFLQGLYLIHNEEPEVGLAKMSRGIDAYQAIGTRFMLSMRFALQAEAFLRTGQEEKASQLLEQAEDFIEETGELFYKAEVLRLKGEVLLLQFPNSSEDAKACFSRALQVAGQQKAKTLELRAAMSLARLWQNQGRLKEAQKLLTPIYRRFTEGFDTPDLKEARALLETLN
ncbi:MAG: hypothetical protein C4583_11800 [Anaerolineaceae bacterium]|nr:MAG: hypothetical protein C4583_11800 [Anaerolineaceae bacterium]